MKLAIKVIPGAKQSRLIGVERDTLTQQRVLRVKVAAPPVEGKANLCLIVFLAKQLGIKKGQLSIQSGESSRRKTLLLPDELEERVKSVLDELENSATE